MDWNAIHAKRNGLFYGFLGCLALALLGLVAALFLQVFFIGLIIIGFFTAFLFFQAHTQYQHEIETFHDYEDHLQEYADKLAVSLGYTDYNDLENREAVRLNVSFNQNLDLNQRVLRYSRALGYKDFAELYKAEYCK